MDNIFKISLMWKFMYTVYYIFYNSQFIINCIFKLNESIYVNNNPSYLMQIRLLITNRIESYSLNFILSLIFIKQSTQFYPSYLLVIVEAQTYHQMSLGIYLFFT